MIAEVANLSSILAHHEIHPKFHAEFRALVEDGVRPGPELLTRLGLCGQLQSGLDEAMAELSKPLGFVFPPTTFQSLSVEEYAR
jgi:hypothetical protein